VGHLAWRVIDGLLLLDKPEGLSSSNALQKARRLFSAAKAGHTGTLDLLASGLLPVCFGEATKFSGGLLAANKSYEALVHLGIRTSTADLEGKIVSQCAVDVTLTQIKTTLEAMLGEQQQVPPMFSAIKQEGKPLYQLARQGISVERKARKVHIYTLELLKRVDNYLHIVVTCSKGTYIRTLAEEIGERLGCGAHLASLRRTAVGDLQIADSHTLSALSALNESELFARLEPVDKLLVGLPSCNLSEIETRLFRCGKAVAPSSNEHCLKDGIYRIYETGKSFIGTGEMRTDALMYPRRLMAKSVTV